MSAGSAIIHCARPRLSSVRCGGKRSDSPHFAQGSAWKLPSRMASRRSGRRSALTLELRWTPVAVPQIGHVMVAVWKIDTGWLLVAWRRVGVDRGHALPVGGHKYFVMSLPTPEGGFF